MSTPKDNDKTEGLHTLVDEKLDRFKCTFEGCKKVFSQKYRLMIHVRSHQGIKPFKCSQCSKTFVEKANLKVHIRTHTGERPYQCDFENCQASFKTSGQLNDHKNKHLNIRRNICIKCGKTFTRKSSLKAHMLIHEDAFPYKCEFEGCDRIFRERSNMKKHLKIHFDTKNIFNLNQHENLNLNNIDIFKLQNEEQFMQHSNILNINYEPPFLSDRLSNSEGVDKNLKKDKEKYESKQEDIFFYECSQNENCNNFNDYL
jgi:uncharacterized Zn-finger protein